MSSVRDANLLEELISELDLHARIAFRGMLCDRWAIGGSRQGRLGFHAVLSGSTWLRLPGAATPVELSAGGMIIYRSDARHLLAASEGGECEEKPARILPVSAAPVATSVGLLCGYFECATVNIPLMEAVPAYLVWKNFDAFPEPVGHVMRALVPLALDPKLGSDRLLAQTCELLMLMILRQPQVLPCECLGLVRARLDPVLQRVLQAIRAHPAKPWTLASMARCAGVSRSTFADRFRQTTDISPMLYVRRYRLALAQRRIREEGLSLAQAARVTGYGSAGALRRAARRR